MNESIIFLPQQLGTLLKSYRKSKSISQKDLSVRLRICQSRISYLENHPEDMSLDQLMTWLAVLGLDLKIAVKSEDHYETDW